MSTANITHAALAHFYGSEQLYFHPMFRSINYTDGVRFLMNNGAAWLVAAILSHAIYTKKVAREEFVVAKLKVDLAHKKAILTFDDGNDHILATQAIEYTDFPLEQVDFYIENKVLMFPSER